MRALGDEPVERRTFAEVALFARREASCRRRSPPWKFAPLIAASTTPPRASLPTPFSTIPGWVAVGPDRRGASALGSQALSPDRSQRHPSSRWAHLRRVRRGRPARRRCRHLRRRSLSAARLDPRPLRPRLPARRARADRQGLRFSSVQEHGHPEDEHVYLWFLAVDPAQQRGGIGRALLARVYEEAEAPVYLDTANPANVPYYASNGYEEIGKADGPRGATMWFMRRP